MSHSPAKYGVLIKWYLHSILDISEIFFYESIYNHSFSVDAGVFTFCNINMCDRNFEFIILYNSVKFSELNLSCLFGMCRDRQLLITMNKLFYAMK